jgi:multiple sugar transport system substrate-binding protein
MTSYLIDRRSLLGLSALTLAAAMLPGSAASAQESEITVWSWASTVPDAVAAYQAANPGRKVNLVNPGSGNDLYLKLRNALRAGSGLPDVSQVQFSMVSSFALTDSLTDLSSYGLGEMKDLYIPWVWDQINGSGKIYSLPWDIGPVAMYYREDLFQKYGLEVPRTWQDMLTQGEKLHQQTSDVFMTSGNFNQPDWFSSMVWQAGGRMYTVDGDKIDININSPEAMKVAEFWQSMLDKKYVDTAPSYNTDWFAGMDAGRYATWIAPKWATNRLTAASSQGMGHWRIAPIPQWQEGGKVSANWGGSVLIVPKGSINPEAAAHFIKWMLSGDGAAYFAKGGLWPTEEAILQSPEFVNQAHEIYGDQKVNQVFLEAASNVSLDWQYSPFQDYVDAQVADKLSAASIGNITLVDALNQLQDIVSNFAQQQGFMVAS